MGLLKKIWFTLTTVVSMAMYVIDVVSDLLLAHRYFKRGHKVWGGCTTAFIAIPWALLGVFGVWLAFDSGIRDRASQMMLVFAVCGMLPIALNLISLKDFFYKNDENEAKANKQTAAILRLVEVVFEAVLQVALQLYICGATNNIDVILAVSIASSLLSTTMGLFNGCMAVVETEFGLKITRYRATFIREVAFSLIFLTWTFLHLFTFIPPLTFLISLKLHTSLAHWTLVLYFFIHLFATLFLSFVYPINGAKVLTPDLPRLLRFLATLRHDLSTRPHLRLASRFSSVILQFLFLITTTTLSAQWIVAIAPFTPNATSSSIPFFIWPDSLPTLQKWTIFNVSDLITSNSNLTMPQFLNCPISGNSTSVPG
jgi:hypothetical protein